MPIEHPSDMGELRDLMAVAFDKEDAPMIEAVQSRMGTEDLFDKHPVLLKIDSGAVQVRRSLRRMIKAESDRIAVFAGQE
jgi:vanillate O-demethylase monooxygenase subunit